MEKNKKYSAEIKDVGKTQVEIECEIPWSEVEKYRKSIIDEYSEKITVPGFRKGRVPENIIIQKIGQMELLNEMVERTLQEIYPKIIIENNINAIGRPTISITKLAEKNPLCFKAVSSIIPKIELPDYKNIAKKITAKEEEVIVEEKDVEETILAIRKQWALHESYEKDHEKGSHEHKTEIDEKDLPELDDKFIKNLGAFENVDEFKKKLRENILSEKKLKEKDKKRAEVIEKILEKTKIDIPEILTNAELEKMISQLKTDVENAKVDFKTYLIKSNKTEEKLREEWKSPAEKKAKIQLVLNEIAEKENLKADEKEIEHEVKHLLEHYKNADPERLKIYVESVLINEKVMQFLENSE